MRLAPVLCGGQRDPEIEDNTVPLERAGLDQSPGYLPPRTQSP